MQEMKVPDITNLKDRDARMLAIPSDSRESFTTEIPRFVAPDIRYNGDVVLLYTDSPPCLVYAVQIVRISVRMIRELTCTPGLK